MTYTEQDLIDEMEYVTKHEFMVLRHLAENGPKYKTGMMQDIIREFPNDMEHGEYLIPGKEYSDDLDQAMITLTNDGAIWYVGGKLALTDYGRALYDTIMAHPEVGIDEDLAEFIERINPCQLGLWEGERMSIKRMHCIQPRPCQCPRHPERHLQFYYDRTLYAWGVQLRCGYCMRIGPRRLTR